MEKKYKTRGGYERRRVAKHSRSGSEASLRPFSSSLLEEIVPGVIRNINESEVFAESLRSGVGLLLWWLFVPIWCFGNAPNTSFFLVIFSEWTVTKGNRHGYS